VIRREPTGDLAELIPHAGSMCLIDTVEAWDERTIRCTTRSHRDPLNPLRRHDRLATLHLCEYGGQAMALHGGLLAREKNGQGSKAAPGMLVAVRDVELAVDRIDDIDNPLTIVACQMIAGSGGWLYEFEVSDGRRRLARGRVTVMHWGGA
jgi:predicted hotdog family 3-hydroxylacyl-ACP dehydratase